MRFYFLLRKTLFFGVCRGSYPYFGGIQLTYSEHYQHDSVFLVLQFDFYLQRFSGVLIGLVGRVFSNGPGDLASISGGVIAKTLKMVLDTSLFYTQRYKVRIKGKIEQSRERSGALPNASV